MTINIPTWYVQQYSTNLNLLLQEKGGKFRPFVMEGPHVGKQASPVDQVGSINASKVTSRFAPMGRVDAPTDRRWVFPVDYDLPQLIDLFDKLRLVTDPESAYVVNGVKAMGRAQDDEIIAAFFASAKTGETGSTSTTFPAADLIGVAFGASSDVGLTVKKLLKGKQLLMANKVELDDEVLTCGISSIQHDNLLNEIQVISRDYNSTPVLVNGKVQAFLGINFLPSERLDLVSGETDERRCPLWAKSGMYLGMWGEITSDISQRKDLQGLPFQVYNYGTFGATRMEEGRVIEIECQE